MSGGGAPWPAAAWVLATSLLVSAAVPAAAMADPVSTTNWNQRYSFEARYDTGSGGLGVLQRTRMISRANRAVNVVNFSVIPRALGSFKLRSVRVNGEDAASS